MLLRRRPPGPGFSGITWRFVYVYVPCYMLYLYYYFIYIVLIIIFSFFFYYFYLLLYFLQFYFALCFGKQGSNQEPRARTIALTARERYSPYSLMLETMAALDSKIKVNSPRPAIFREVTLPTPLLRRVE